MAADRRTTVADIWRDGWQLIECHSDPAMFCANSGPLSPALSPNLFAAMFDNDG
jgi:hypothetical protein